MRYHTPVKDSAAFPRTSHAISIASINSPPPSSESSFSDLHHRRRIGLIELSTRWPKLRCDWITCLWSPADVIFDIITTTSASKSALANVACLRHHQSACWRHPLTFSWRLTLTRFDCWLWPELTFCSTGAPYPVFHVDFIFAVHFCIFCF